MKPDRKIEFKAINEDGDNINIIKEGENYLINDKPFIIDYQWINKDSLHIIANNINYMANIVEVDASRKNFSIEINNHIYSIRLKDQFDSQLELMGLKKNVGFSQESIKAPMPGLVVEILVNENQEIKKGDNILILKAMKMENIIKSITDATIKKILVKKGDTVEKNQELITL